MRSGSGGGVPRDIPLALISMELFQPSGAGLDASAWGCIRDKALMTSSDGFELVLSTVGVGDR